MNMKISYDMIAAAARELDVDPHTLDAVYRVESSQNGFLPSGKPRILFEGHIFWKELKKAGHPVETFDALSAKYPGVLYQKWTKNHYLGGEKEYGRLKTALEINRTAALASASWGCFQIMGMNYAACGFKSVEAFVEAQHESAASQLSSFCAFLKTNRLVPYLKKLDWSAFAKAYNGPEYKKNQYDQKLAQAYEQSRREHGIKNAKT